MKQIKEIKSKDGYVIRRKVITINEEPSLAIQAFKEDCDVNIILDRYMKTGELPQTRQQGIYADISEIPDLTQAIQIVKSAEDAFMSLPAKTRLEFENDPRKLLHFLQDPKNEQRGIELGLIEPKPVKEDGKKASTPSEGAMEGQSKQ